MTAREHLSQARLLDARINRMIADAEKMRMLAFRASHVMDGMPRASGVTDGHASTVCRLVDMEREINDEIDRLIDTKTEIEKAIDTVARADFRELLKMRYLSGFTWERITEALHYSPESRKWLSKELHAQALGQVRFTPTPYPGHVLSLQWSQAETQAISPERPCNPPVDNATAHNRASAAVPG